MGSMRSKVRTFYLGEWQYVFGSYIRQAGKDRMPRERVTKRSVGK